MPEDVHLLTFGELTVAARLRSAPTPVDGGLLLPAGRIALLHGMPDAQVYRHGWNSWSPSGWRQMHQAPLRIAAAERRLTADDTAWDDPHRHHSSAVTALTAPDGNVLLVGALGLDVPRLTVDRDTINGPKATQPIVPPRELLSDFKREAFSTSCSCELCLKYNISQLDLDGWKEGGMSGGGPVKSVHTKLQERALVDKIKTEIVGAYAPAPLVS